MRERLFFLLIFVVLGHPLRRLKARTLKLTYCPIEMYGKGALGGAKMYSGCNARAFHAFFKNESVYYMQAEIKGGGGDEKQLIDLEWPNGK